jgi:hypothetical protein
VTTNRYHKEADLVMQQLHLRRTALFVLLPALALLAPAAARAADKDAELHGFGKAKFGISEEQAKALYPKLQEEVVKAAAKPGEEPLPFSLSNYTLDNQSFGPLKKCKVRLQFFQHEFTSVNYACAGGSEKIISYLKKRFGEPQFTSQRRALTWVPSSYTVTAMEVSGTFSILDTQRSRHMSQVLMALAMKKLNAEAPTPMATATGENATPAVTPETPK